MIDPEKMNIYSFLNIGNMTSLAFPLFTAHMFRVLGLHWPNAIFGLLGVLMIPIPFVCI